MPWLPPQAGLRREGAIALAKALSTGAVPKLRRLDMAENTVLADGAAALCQAWAGWVVPTR
jgi:hypothetical protein